MYLIKMSFYKKKGEVLSSVEAPSFFIEGDFDKVQEYISKQQDVATVYAEYVAPAPPSEVLLVC